MEWRRWLFAALRAGPISDRLWIAKRQLAVVLALGAGLAVPMATASAGERWFYIGADGGPHAISTYQGVLWAPFNGLGETGPQVRLAAKGLLFDYDTDLPAPGGGAVNTNIEAYGYGGNAEIGYQWADTGWRLAVFAGAAWRQYNLTPDDPGADLDGSHLAVSATVDGEWRFVSSYGVMANASYLSGVDQYWVEVKPFRDLGGGFKAGPAVAFFGGKDYEMGRAGAFFSGYELPFRLSAGRIFVGGAAGVQWDIDDHRVTPFGGLNVGLLF